MIRYLIALALVLSPVPALADITGKARVIDGDTIEVAPGTYFEAIDFLGKAIALRSPDGQLVGAFELINKLQGNFTDLDEAGLGELDHSALIKAIDPD